MVVMTVTEYSSAPAKFHRGVLKSLLPSKPLLVVDKKTSRVRLVSSSLAFAVQF